MGLLFEFLVQNFQVLHGYIATLGICHFCQPAGKAQNDEFSQLLGLFFRQRVAFFGFAGAALIASLATARSLTASGFTPTMSEAERFFAVGLAAGLTAGFAAGFFCCAATQPWETV